MADENPLTSHRHTFDVTIAPVCDVCGLPLTEMLQIAQEEIEEVKQEVALVQEKRDEFLETLACQAATIQQLEALLQRAVPLLQHALILEAMPEQQRDQANDLVEKIRTALGQQKAANDDE